MHTRKQAFLRATAGFLAGSLLGCAPAGLIGQLSQSPKTEPGNLQAIRGTMGDVNFTFRWPGVYTRQAQALPNSAKYVVVLVWTDATRKTAAAVRVFKRDNPNDTYFNKMTGRYESSGRLILAPGEGYVLDLKAFATDPGYREVNSPTPVDELTCGTAPTPTPTPEATASSDTATPDATPTPAPTPEPCFATATALAYGSSVAFKVVPGHSTPVRVNLTVKDGPTVAGVSPAVLGYQGGEVVVAGTGFGTDPGKVRLALVPTYVGSDPRELQALEVSDTMIKTRIPENTPGGTIYAFVDGVEAGAGTTPATVQVVRKLFITSESLRFDQNNKVYAAANATVSLGVYGEPLNGGACCWDPNRPNILPNGLLQLPASILTVAPTGTTTATASVGAGGTVVFPGKGTWKIANAGGIEQAWPGDVTVGIYQAGSGAALQFTRGPWDLNSPVSALVPNAAEPWFCCGQGISNTAAPMPNVGLFHPDGRLQLKADDFTWSTAPSDALGVNQDGTYAVSSVKRQDVKFTGTFKLDTTKKVEGTLKTGFTIAVSPDDVSLSQPVTGGTADLTKQKLYFTLTAPNGASASTIPPCQGCNPQIPSNQYSWASSDESLAKVDSGGIVSVMTTSATGDVSITVSLTTDPDHKATSSVHVTDNGGLVLDVQ